MTCSVISQNHFGCSTIRQFVRDQVPPFMWKPFVEPVAIFNPYTKEYEVWNLLPSACTHKTVMIFFLLAPQSKNYGQWLIVPLKLSRGSLASVPEGCFACLACGNTNPSVSHCPYCVNATLAIECARCRRKADVLYSNIFTQPRSDRLTVCKTFMGRKNQIPICCENYESGSLLCVEEVLPGAVRLIVIMTPRNQ